jgi:hypothetical protein
MTIYQKQIILHGMVIPQLKTYTDFNCVREIPLSSVSSPEYRRLLKYKDDGETEKFVMRWLVTQQMDLGLQELEHCPTSR